MLYLAVRVLENWWNFFQSTLLSPLLGLVLCFWLDNVADLLLRFQKERGVDEAATAINNYGAVEETNRVEHDRDKKLSDHSILTHNFRKIKDVHQRATSEPERRDQWVDDDERTQGSYWTRFTDRQLSPEMFHNPIEQLKSSNVVDLRHGKTASAVELAQAFSRSLSDPKVNDRLLGRSEDTGPAQQPFSRLVGLTPKPSSNG
ncbi:hypothetical protein QN277_020090 [Acacia crassicarpa]|uniref:Uncharacterized protein n=1 Tax=Acacia crassicarpa TaxID=499986 RepID=A0AAE1MRS9_9FABA|nr:hypothetical protein QN277_020090 [Acacia crassicarpa]